MLASVVIPALNEAAHIAQAVRCAQRQYPPEQVEIIVCDGGSVDETASIAQQAGATVIHAPRGRAVQLNRGAAAARGGILVFCHADSQLPADWLEAVQDALDRPGVSGGTFQTLILPAMGPVMRIRNKLHFAARWQVMFGDQAQFMRRATFAQVGGFPELPLMEDVEMSRALAQVGRVVRIKPDVRVVTSSRRFLERGFVRLSLQNGWRMIRYLYLGATPEQIAASYRSSREEAQ